MCTEGQLNKIVKAMVECYRNIYGSAIVDIIIGNHFCNRGAILFISNLLLKNLLTQLVIKYMILNGKLF